MIELQAIYEKNSNLDSDILMLSACIDNSKPIIENYDLIFNNTDKAFINDIFKIDKKLDLAILPYELDCSGCKNKFAITLDSSEVEYTIAFPSFF